MKHITFYFGIKNETLASNTYANLDHVVSANQKLSDVQRMLDMISRSIYRKSDTDKESAESNNY